MFISISNIYIVHGAHEVAHMVNIFLAILVVSDSIHRDEYGYVVAMPTI